MKKVQTALGTLVAGGLLGAATMALIQVLWPTQSVVLVRNWGAVAMTDVTVALSERVLWQGALPPGEAIRVPFKANENGPFRFRYTTDRRTEETIGYVSNHIPEHHFLIFTTSGTVLYVHCDFQAKECF